jgi:hypothetical protein
LLRVYPKKLKSASEGEIKLKAFDEEYKLAVGALGIQPDYFWKLTYTELMLLCDQYIEGRKQDAKDKHDIAAINAFYTAKMVGDIFSGRTVRLEDYIKTTHEEKPQTPEEMIAFIECFAAANGGKTVINE